ncbi:MAG TPA: NmrA/HSCARG family protein [Actinoplanes sp.]|nr:NmrA/HSCARG family protein [Actinoplanes sp.]
MAGQGRIVAVTGATGRQGGAVARRLLADGWQVRAVTRKPEGQAARALAAAGAEVVRADMLEPDTLLPAFRDAYGVYSVQNFMPGGTESEIKQGRNVADAAKAVGVQHVVYGAAGPRVRGTGIASWESKLTVQAHLRGLDLPLTVLRPMAFMELMTDKDFYPAVSTWSLMPKLMGEDRPVGWICADDLGAVAARAFADPGRFVGAELELVSEVLSIAQCREIWRDVHGRSPRGFPMPVWLFRRFVGDDLLTMWRWLRTAQLEFDPALTRELVPDALTVRQWLARRRQAT